MGSPPGAAGGDTARGGLQLLLALWSGGQGTPSGPLIPLVCSPLPFGLGRRAEEMERRGWIVKVYLCCTEKFSVSSLFSKEPHEFLDRWEHDIICAITRRRHGRQEDQL